MRVTQSQMKVLNIIKEAGTIEEETLRRQVNNKVLNNLFEKGLLHRENCSRLRTDDMEMVYWKEISVIPDLIQEIHD